MTAVSIRPLDPLDWQELREFRLAALRASPGVYYGKLADEEKLSPQEWRDRIAAPDHHQVFGLFEAEKLVGITAVFTDRDDLSGQTAHFAFSFILPSHRGRGLSRMLYEARLAWVRARPKFRRILVGHRSSNEPSRRAMLAQGFVRIGQEPRVWPDGITEDDVHYEQCISQ